MLAWTALEPSFGSEGLSFMATKRSKKSAEGSPELGRSFLHQGLQVRRHQGPA